MFSLFQKFKEGLAKTKSTLVHEIKRIVTLSPKLSGASLEEIEMALLAADLGTGMTDQICREARKAYETQGRAGLDFLEIARREVEKSLANAESPLIKLPGAVTVVSMVGVNGTGKTTTAAKLAHRVQSEGLSAILAACDTFRAAAIDQLKLWGQRVNVPVVASEYGADPASVAHDAVVAAQGRKADYLFVDTAGRLHTKHNLMLELMKVHRVMDKKLPGAPHETLLVLDGSTGMNALNQAKEFNKAVKLTGLVITKLDGTSKGGMVVAIHRELGLPIKFIGLGESPEDLQPFSAKEFAAALFSE
ncbi:MAG: signal recognition particle-docking protein FtsY [Verrucomicrobia bacterium]|nr:signal recognition particle-docking protein FtsY [Verrucomicrobiota bacterium]MBI3866951.1 signal recognition particle-docking protein FtsY [Verrucomicrobiota bacterium]